MRLRTLSSYLALSLAITVPSYSSEDLTSLFKRYSSIEGDANIEPKDLFPKGHALHEMEDPKSAADVKKFVEAALALDRPEARLIILGEMDGYYGSLLSDFIQMLDDEFEQLQKKLEDVSVIEGKPKPMNRDLFKLEELEKQINEIFEPQDVKGFIQAFKEAEALIQADPSDKEKLGQALGIIRKALGVLRASIEAKQLALRHDRFDTILKAPELCPAHAREWRVRTLALGHLYLGHLNGERAEFVSGHLQNVCEQLSKDLAPIGRRDQSAFALMQMLFEPWKVDVLKEAFKERRPSAHMMPAPLPMAALNYSWSRVYLDRVLRSNVQNAELVQAFYDKALQCAEIFGTQDEMPDFLEIRAITHGRSRLLALELLKYTYWDLVALGEKLLVSADDLEKYKSGIRAKARDLAGHMIFDSRMGDSAKFYKAFAFSRISHIHDDPLTKYICLMSAQNVYQEATYTDVHSQLASYFMLDGVFGRVWNLEKDKQYFGGKAAELRGDALRLVLDQAYERGSRGVASASLVEMIARYTEARALHSAAQHIEQAESPTELDAIDNTLASLIGEFTTEQIGQLDAVKMNLEKNPSPETFAQLTALVKEIPTRINAAQGEVEAVSKPFSQFSAFGWKYERHPAWKTLDTTLFEARDFEKAKVKEYLKERQAFYVSQAEQGDATALAEQYVAELLELKKVLSNGSYLWGHAVTVLELRCKPHIKAISESKALAEAAGHIKAAEDFIASQRDAYPRVFNDFEVIVAEEIRIENIARKTRGQELFTRETYKPSNNTLRFRHMYGFTMDAWCSVPEVWLTAMQDAGARVAKARGMFVKSYKPSVTTLDLVSLQALQAELLQFNQWFDQEERRRGNYHGGSDSRLDQAAQYLANVIPILQEVKWEGITTAGYRELLDKLSRAQPNGWCVDRTLQQAYQRKLKELVLDRLWASLDNQGLVSILSNADSLCQFLGEQQRGILEGMVTRKIKEWCDARRPAILELKEAINQSDDPIVKLAAYDQMHPLLVAYEEGLKSMNLNQFYQGGERVYRIFNRWLVISIPAADIDVGCKADDVVKEKNELHVKIFKDRFEDFRARANAVKDKTEVRAEKAALYKVIRDEANVFLAEVREQKTGATELNVLSGQVGGFVRKLSGFVFEFEGK